MEMCALTMPAIFPYSPRNYFEDYILYLLSAARPTFFRLYFLPHSEFLITLPVFFQKVSNHQY